MQNIKGPSVCALDSDVATYTDDDHDNYDAKPSLDEEGGPSPEPSRGTPSSWSMEPLRACLGGGGRGPTTPRSGGDCCSVMMIMLPMRMAMAIRRTIMVIVMVLVMVMMIMIFWWR